MHSHYLNETMINDFSKAFPKAKQYRKRKTYSLNMYHMSGNVLNDVQVLTQFSTELYQLDVIVISSATNDKNQDTEDYEEL